MQLSVVGNPCLFLPFRITMLCNNAVVLGVQDVNGLTQLKIAAVGAPFARLINFPGDILPSLLGKTSSTMKIQRQAAASISCLMPRLPMVQITQPQDQHFFA